MYASKNVVRIPLWDQLEQINRWTPCSINQTRVHVIAKHTECWIFMTNIFVHSHKFQTSSISPSPRNGSSHRLDTTLIMDGSTCSITSRQVFLASSNLKSNVLKQVQPDQSQKSFTINRGPNEYCGHKKTIVVKWLTMRQSRGLNDIAWEKQLKNFSVEIYRLEGLFVRESFIDPSELVGKLDVVSSEEDLESGAFSSCKNSK